MEGCKICREAGSQSAPLSPPPLFSMNQLVYLLLRRGSINNVQLSDRKPARYGWSRRALDNFTRQKLQHQRWQQMPRLCDKLPPLTFQLWPGRDNNGVWMMQWEMRCSCHSVPQTSLLPRGVPHCACHKSPWTEPNPRFIRLSKKSNKTERASSGAVTQLNKS